MSVKKVPSCSFWLIYPACGVVSSMNHIINSKYTTQVPVSGESSNMVCAFTWGGCIAAEDEGRTPGWGQLTGKDMPLGRSMVFLCVVL